MNALNTKQPYTAPDARRTRVRPVSPVRARRHPEGTWKDRAQAALAAPAGLRRELVTLEVTLEAVRDDIEQPVRARVKHDWQWWQIIAPAIITACAIAQLSHSVR